MDSGAIHHLTNNVHNLTEGTPYLGSQLLLVGNGHGLEIMYTGYTCFLTSLGTSLSLTNVLCVPKITKNLISISKHLLDNNIIIEFSSNLCFIKDKMEGTLLAQGIAEGGLYRLLSEAESSSQSANQYLSPNSMLSVFSTNKIVNSSQESNSLNSGHYPASFLSLGSESIKLLHNRFGHPNKHTLQAIIKCLPLHSVNNSSIDFCNAC